MAERNVKLPVQRNDVISYEDDVYAWVYLDHIDRLLRYEAYVVGYNQAGEPTTLELVIEEGTLEDEATAAAAALFGEPFETWQLLRRLQTHPLGSPTGGGHSVGTYPRIDAERTRQLHTFFETHEEELKRRYRNRWIKRLRALGFDIVPSL